MRFSIEERFWQHVQKTDGCWEWSGEKTKEGYGRFWNGIHRIMAHRFSYELTYGPIPPDLDCCHHCDNPKCIRPDHLFLGTAKENMLDAFLKGRRKRRLIISKPKKENDWRIEVFRNGKYFGFRKGSGKNRIYRYGGKITDLQQKENSL